LTPPAAINLQIYERLLLLLQKVPGSKRVSKVILDEIQRRREE